MVRLLLHLLRLRLPLLRLLLPLLRFLLPLLRLLLPLLRLLLLLLPLRLLLRCPSWCETSNEGVRHVRLRRRCGGRIDIGRVTIRWKRPRKLRLKPWLGGGIILLLLRRKPWLPGGKILLLHLRPRRLHLRREFWRRGRWGRPSS